MEVFYVEDDINIRNMTLYSLKQVHINARGFGSGHELLDILKHTIPDLILLDIMLPDIDGIEVLKRLRSNPSTTDVPIIMLTAKGTESDIVNALNSGADDYLVKPFGMMELISRINALIRRTNPRESDENNIISAHNIVIDSSRHIASIKNQELILTVKEFDLLKLFITNIGRVLSRDQILERVWNMNFIGESRTVDMHVLTLRHKLDEISPGASALIETVRGIGYRFKAENEY